MTKPQILTTLGISVITALSIGSFATGAFDPVVFQTQLDNHTARINNLEVKTGTTPPPEAPQTTSTTSSTSSTPSSSTSTAPSSAPASSSPVDTTPTQPTAAQTTTTQSQSPPPSTHHDWTLSDIDRVLQETAPPGQMRPEKQTACRKQGADYGASQSTIDSNCSDFDLRGFASY